MNGSRLLLDTNAVVQLLKGNTFLVDKLKQSEYLAISIISKLEFYSFSGLSEADRSLFARFEKRLSVIDLENSAELVQQIASLRVNTSLKLPDAIISATSHLHGCTLVTSDKSLLTQSVKH